MQPAPIVFICFFLAGEQVRFNAALQPQFTDNQVQNSAESTRAGLSRWAATEHGQKLIAFFSKKEYRITITEDSGEDGVGRAPQPGIATLAAASDHSKVKTYDLILNPTCFKMPKGMQPLRNQPATAADVMAAAWAGEMLHIYFYAQGISLPHHQRLDFQEEWRTIARELGIPTVRHDDEDESERGRRSIRIVGYK